MSNIKWISLIILLLILSSSLILASHEPTESPIDITIDSLGTLVGLITFVYMIRISKYFKGSLRKSFTYGVYGVGFEVLALAEHTFYDYGVHLVPVSFDIHHIIMAVGIALFGISAYNLKNMMVELKKK